MHRSWPLWLCALFWLISAGLVVATRPGQAGIRAALLLPDLFQDMPLQPSRWVRPAPLQERVTYRYRGREAGGDLYRPAGPGPYPGFVFALGVSPAGLDDPRVVRFGQTLARAGFIVLIPDSPDLRRDRVLPEEIDGLVTAFQLLQQRPEADRHRLGLVGVSVGGGLALIAAADPRIANDLAFVNVLGAYSDARSLIAAVTTQRVRVGGRPSAWHPDPMSVRIVRTVLIDTLDSPQEQRRVWELLAQSADQPPSSSPAVIPLSPAAQAVYELLRNDDPARVDALLQRLPLQTQQRLHQLSPSTYLNGLRAPLSIMHDRGDRAIPFSESRQLVMLAAALHPWYSEFDIFQHVDLKGQGGGHVLVRDSVKLFVHLLHVLNRLET